jgi:hypothetical protein
LLHVPAQRSSSPPDHRRARGDGRAAVGHPRGVGAFDFDRVEGKAKRLGDDLRVDGSRSLTDVRARHQDARPTLGEFERGPRCQLDLAGAGESRAVEEEGEAEAAAGAAERAPAPPEVGALHRFAQHPQRARVAAQHLAGGGGVAGTQRVDLAELHRVHAQPLRHPLHLDLGGELRLRHPEAAERAGWRVVGGGGSWMVGGG